MIALAGSLLLTVLSGIGWAQTNELERDRKRGSERVASDHPRLWLTEERKALLRSKACLDKSGNLIPGCELEGRYEWFVDHVLPFGYWDERAWHHALAYVITGKRSHAHTAISYMDSIVADITSDEDRGQSNFLNIAGNMRSTALVYDWCYDLLSVAQRRDYRAYMNQLMNELWNPFNNPTHLWNGWAVDDPGNNFYYSFLLGTAYVALATYGENDYPHSLPFDGTTYNDLMAFLQAKIEQQSMPMYLDTWGKGGSWHEGNNYGLLSKRLLFETFLILRDAGVKNYFEETAFPREAILYHLYSMQPGFEQVYPGGDIPRETLPYDRHLMLYGADALAGTVEAEYAQYFSNNIELATPFDWWDFIQPYDILMYDPSRPERDFSELPLSYFAEGGDWMNSRSGWDADAVSVSFVCTNRIQQHQAQDQNAFLIYCGNLQATSGNLHSNWGIYQRANAFNTILINGEGQAYGGNQDTPTETVRDIGNVIKQESGTDFTYIAGDARDAYYTNAGQFGYGDDPLLHTFVRELVHILPGLVVVFDRITPIDSTHIPTWMLQTELAPTITGNRVTASAGGGQLYNWVLLPELHTISAQIHPGGYAFGSWDSLEHFVTEVEPAAPAPNHRMLNVLFTSELSNPSVPQVSSITTKSGNMVGVEIINAGARQVVLFSSNPDISLPVTGVSINAVANAKGDYRLFGMVPGGDYAVNATGTPSGQCLVVASGNAFKASANGVLHFRVDSTGTAREWDIEEAPSGHRITQRLQMDQNHPNPFNPTTTISFSLPANLEVSLSVIDVRGRLIRNLIKRSLDAGRHEIVWDGRDGRGNAASSGIYFYRLSAGGETMTRKMVLLK
jgi:hypothetical protein